MRWPTLFASVLLYSCSHTQDVDTIRTFVLADTIVHIVKHSSGKSGPLYFNMHDDEQTSVDAARDIVARYGGELFELVHSGMRNIAFTMDSMRYQIDPNRIYTDAGIWRELRRNALVDSVRQVHVLRTRDSLLIESLRDSLIQAGDSLLYEALRSIISFFPVTIENALLKIHDPLPPRVFVHRDTMVFDLINAFADSLLLLMDVDNRTLVITLHNNTNNGYSLGSYLVDSIYESEAQSTYRGLHPDPDDFYFVTARRIFEVLQPNHYHIILQDNARMTDDGSLSVYCGLRGINYVNVEAQHEHLKEQKEMLKILAERLVMF